MEFIQLAINAVIIGDKLLTIGEHFRKYFSTNSQDIDHDNTVIDYKNIEIILNPQYNHTHVNSNEPNFHSDFELL